MYDPVPRSSDFVPIGGTRRTAYGSRRSTSSNASLFITAARVPSGLNASPHAYDCVRSTRPAGVTRRPLTSTAVSPTMRACESRPGGSNSGAVPARDRPQATVTAQAAAHVSSFRIERRQRGEGNDEG